MKHITPQSILNRIKASKEQLRAEGKEITIDNLNALAIRKLREQLKEDGNE